MPTPRSLGSKSEDIKVPAATPNEPKVKAFGPEPVRAAAHRTAQAWQALRDELPATNSP